MTLPRYAAYKDSGVQWLGEVPAHWQACAAKRWIASRAGGTLIKGECASEPGEGLVPAFSASGQDVWVEAPAYHQPGVVLSAVGARCGKTFKADGAWGVVANTHCLFPLQSASRDFVWYLTNQEDWWERGGTAQPFIKVSETLARTWAFPPPEEQAAIATFLDRETAKIDALIAEQEKLIALLAEKRQATISHAVTKGLNPDARMKDSGVPWLGEVPAHWEVLPLKRFLSFLTSGSRGWAEHYSDDGAIFLRIGNLTRDGVELDLSDIQRVSPPEGAEGSRTRVEPGDVLFSITAFLGSVATVPEGFAEAYVSQHVALARLIPDGLQPRWVAYTTLSDLGVTYLASQGYGGTKIQLSLDDIRNLPVTVPPPHEQQATLQFLDSELTKLRDLRCEAEHAVALLKERRSALIAAAVTGQIDVRGAVSADAA